MSAASGALMKKHVTFGESQTTHRLHHDEALWRASGFPVREEILHLNPTWASPDKIQTESSLMLVPNEELFGLKVELAFSLRSAIKHTGANRGFLIYGPAAARTLQIQDETTTHSPKGASAGPVLTHSALTPAQRGYLCTIAASHSWTRARQLLTQHYVNVLHRWTRTGSSPDRQDAAATSVMPQESENEKNQSESETDVYSWAKHRGRKNTKTRPPGKSFLPNIQKGQKRFSNISASQQRRMRKHKTSPKVKTSQRRFKQKRLKEEDEEEEEGRANSLSQCLSFLSVIEQGDHSSSDSVIL